MTKASASRIAARRARPAIAYVTLPHGRAFDRATPRRRETIRQFVERTGWERRGLPVICTEVVRGVARPVPRAKWHRRIRRRDQLAFVAMPRNFGGQGGGSKSIGALIAMIAVIAIATIVAGPAGFLSGTAIGAAIGKTGLAIVSAVIMAGGSALVSHFLSPKPGGQDKSEKDPLSVSFGGNQARPQQPITVQYGRLKFFPDYATSPWSSFSGKDQIFHGLYSLGVGEFEIEEIGFGTTPVWTSTGGTSPDFPSFQHEIVGPGEPVTLFPSNVAVSADVSGQELQDPNVYVGPFIINAAGTVGRRLSLDFIWPGGSHRTSNDGKKYPWPTAVRVQYRYVDGSGVPINPTWVTAADLNWNFYSKIAARKTVEIDLPTAGRVQVRACRTNALETENGTNAVVWAAARLYLQGSETRPKVTLMALRVVSDKSLSAYGSQQIYVIATRKIPVWTGSAWVKQATQNPVWAAVDLWHDTDYGGGQSRDKIDLAALAGHAAAATARGDTFNYRFTDQMTVLEGLEVILRPMLAQPVYVWDRLSLIRDADERETPKLLLTDFQIIRGSVQLEYTLADARAADGVIVEYVEEETWQRAEISSTGDLADLVHPARVQIPGVTNRRQAALCARYLAASTRYRRRLVTLEVEAEGKLLSRGSLVAVQTELPQSWGQAVRIDAVDVAARKLTMHAPMEWTGAASFYLLLRTAQGAPFGPVLVTQGASPEIAILDAAGLAFVQTQSGMLLADVLARSAASEAPTGLFSAGEPRHFEGLLTGLRNAGEGRFSLDLVIDAPEMYEIDDDDVPALPPPPPLAVPAVPGAITGINARLVQEGATLSLYAAWDPAPGAQTYTVQASLIPDEDADEISEADREWATIYPNGFEPTLQIVGLPNNDHLLRIRGTSGNGANGPWSTFTVTTPGLDLTPSGLGNLINFEDLASDAVEEILGQGVVVAEAGAISTGVKVTIAAGDTSAGAAAAYDVMVQGGAAGSPTEVGLRVEIHESAPGSGVYLGRVIVKSSQFYIADPALEFVPFAVVGGEVVLQGVARFANVVRSNAEDANGNPLWSLDPNGAGSFSGVLRGVTLEVGEIINLSPGAEIFKGQFPYAFQKFSSPTHFAGEVSASMEIGIDRIVPLNIGEDFATMFDETRIVGEPVRLTTVSANGVWIHPDGQIVEGSGDTPPASGGGTKRGLMHPEVWDRRFIHQPTFPKRNFYFANSRDTYVTVPPGCTKIQAKCWGGGGGCPRNYIQSTRFGGAGGYVAGTFDVEPGEVLLVRVGPGGSWAEARTSTLSGSNWFPYGSLRGYGEGGRCTNGLIHQASGGGLTMIARVAANGALTPLLIAGGGGSVLLGTSGTSGGPASSSTGGNVGTRAGQSVTGLGNNYGAGGGGAEGGSMGKGGTNFVHGDVSSSTSSAGSTSGVPANTSDSDYAAFVAAIGGSNARRPGYGYLSNGTVQGPLTGTNGSLQAGVGAGGLAVLNFLNT